MVSCSEIVPCCTAAGDSRENCVGYGSINPEEFEVGLFDHVRSGVRQLDVSALLERLSGVS